MARRKRQLLDDDDPDTSSASDDGGDGENEYYGLSRDEREERELLNNPYKRRKVGQSWDSDLEDEEYPTSSKSSKKANRQAPVFTSGAKLDPQSIDISEEHIESGSEDTEEEDGDEGEGSVVDSEPEEEEEEPVVVPRVPSPETANPFRSRGLGSRGIGANASFAPKSNAEPVAAIPQGTVRSGIGSKSQFTAQSSVPPQSAPLTASEKVHFRKLEGSFGARMLAGMGWQPGTGLGASREGIVTPIESKLRPRNMGIAFKGFDEKTSQAKQEAKRRARREGLPVSSDEEKPGGSKGRKSKAGTSQQRADAWKKPRKSKHKVEHKTYEQILAETAQETSSVGIIIDATGAQHRELSSLAELASVGWIPSQEPTHIPEVRHNMRLIANGCKSDLEKIAQEARLVDEAKKRLALEDKRLRDQADQEAELISRLQALHLTVDELSEKARELEQLPVTTLDAFETVIEKLTTVNPKEYSSYHVDEIVVAALAPSIRKIMLEWDPLANPESMAHTFHAWRQALQLPPLGHRNNQNPDDARSRVMPDAPMTPYESLLWNVWMPKIRSTINNEWLPSDPKSLTGLYEEWKDILPSFVQDNVMDQLILPKVQKAVSEWNSRSGVPLQTLVFPWLPHLGLRTEGVLSEACRKVKALLRSWDIREGAPPDLVTWKEMFSASEWESMILKYVIPKLGASMRADFKVNPRKQEMATLNQVISWHPFVRPSVFSQLLETEFFPKWLDALHLWLTAPSANYEEIARWYDEWKKAFPVAVRELSAVQEGFERATKLMHDALSLGPKAAGSLPRPEHRPLRDSGQRTKAPATPSKVPPSRTAEITFRALVEDFASSHNLLFIPLGRSHPTSRMPLYRVSAGIDGKNGLTVFIMDDAVWLVEGDDYHAISLEDMILRATKITRS